MEPQEEEEEDEQSVFASPVLGYAAYASPNIVTPQRYPPQASSLNSSYHQIQHDHGVDHDDGDDVDVILRHEDFINLLTLTIQVKQLHQNLSGTDYTISSSTKTATSDHDQQDDNNNEPNPREVLVVMDRMHKRLLSGNERGAGTKSRKRIYRGEYPIMDSILDDALMVMKREKQHAERFLEQQGALATTKKKRCYSQKEATGNKKEAIAIKYSKWQTDILMNWMIEHLTQPFPNQEDVVQLMQQTGLSQSQIINWTTNVRKRNRKATCERGKKPHHFIDFLFLAQDRQDRQRQQKEQMQMKHETFQKPAPPAPSASWWEQQPPPQLKQQQQQQEDQHHDSNIGREHNAIRQRQHSISREVFTGRNPRHRQQEPQHMQPLALRNETQTKSCGSKDKGVGRYPVVEQEIEEERNLEPLDVSCVTDDAVLEEFASVWLENTACKEDADEELDSKLKKKTDTAGQQHDDKQVSTRMSAGLLSVQEESQSANIAPSVTTDSNEEDDHNVKPRRRQLAHAEHKPPHIAARSTSNETQMDIELDDIHNWAAEELGLEVDM